LGLPEAIHCCVGELSSRRREGGKKKKKEIRGGKKRGEKEKRSRTMSDTVV